MCAMQFEAASAMQQAPQPAFSFPAPQSVPSSGVAGSAASSAAVLACASYEESSQKHGLQSTERSQQSSLGSHSVDLGQHKSKERKESLVFSNPTFASYLDSSSDDELQPVSGCTTPRSAIKQQASQMQHPILHISNKHLIHPSITAICLACCATRASDRPGLPKIPTLCLRSATPFFWVTGAPTLGTETSHN